MNLCSVETAEYQEEKQSYNTGAAKYKEVKKILENENCKRNEFHLKKLSQE